MSIILNIQGEKLIIPEKNDPCPLWVSFFNALKKEVGIANARELWLITWQKNGSIYCTTNQEFNRWVKKNKIDVSNAYTRNLATTTNIGSNILGLVNNSTGVLKVAIPVVAIGLLYFIFKIAYNTTKDANLTDVVTMLPQTKALKLL